MLEAEDLRKFASDGLLVPRWRFKECLVDRLLAQLPQLDRHESTVMEVDRNTPRAFHGGHEDTPVFAELTRRSVLLRSVQQILQDRVYVYQFKVNLKAAFTGDTWPWHQDYSFWSKEDAMLEPRAVTVAVFLDDIHEFNGPIYFIPGSHRDGCLDRDFTGAGACGGWREHVAAALRYQTAEDNVSWLALNHGLVAPKGPRGSVLFFDSNIVHASPANISPFERRIVFITYNSIHNLPRNTNRPAFLVNRYTAPLQPLDDESDDVESTTVLAHELA